MTADRPVLILAGPTGSGKSALALALATRFAGTIINADSMQVYAELRVLTARPSPNDEDLLPHRLYGVVPASERWSVGRWLEAASKEIEAAWQAGRLPVVTGGTGLYLKALMEGLSPLPAVSAELCRDLEALYEQEGGQVSGAFTVVRSARGCALAGDGSAAAGPGDGGGARHRAGVDRVA